MIKILYFVLIFGSSFELMAASRTVQFAGTAVSVYSTADINTYTKEATCYVTIVNLGSTSQIVESASFFDLNYSSSSKTGSVSTTFDSYYGTSSTIASDCIGKTLTGSGGFCILSFTENTLPAHARIGICAGKITVKDASASAPGSVIASGAISMVQESMVLGGVLSGAYYASGVHLNDTSAPNIAPTSTPTANSAPAVSVGGSYNMNHYCAAACKVSRSTKTVPSTYWSDDDCEAQCGYKSTTDAGWTRNITAAIEEDDATSIATSTTTGSGTYSTNTKYYLRYANPHYAGGMVVEMIHGPLSSICSGNTQYYKMGGQDFLHSDGVDSHIVIKENESNYPGAPPERLLCNHRHLKEDLFSRVGSSIPIVINGGNPF